MSKSIVSMLYDREPKEIDDEILKEAAKFHDVHKECFNIIYKQKYEIQQIKQAVAEFCFFIESMPLNAKDKIEPIHATILNIFVQTLIDNDQYKKLKKMVEGGG